MPSAVPSSVPSSVQPAPAPTRRPRRLPSRAAEPPLDPPPGGDPRTPVIRGSLALAVPQPGYPPGPALHLVADDERTADAANDPSVAAAVIVRALAEVLSGIRPARHLAGWTTEGLQLSLERRQPPLRRAPVCSVRSVRVYEPRPGAAEVTAVIRRGSRVGALAARLEFGGDRWRLTALEVG